MPVIMTERYTGVTGETSEVEGGGATNEDETFGSQVEGDGQEQDARELVRHHPSCHRPCRTGNFGHLAAQTSAYISETEDDMLSAVRKICSATGPGASFFFPKSRAFSWPSTRLVCRMPKWENLSENL